MQRKTEKERETSWAPLFQLPKKNSLLQGIMGNYYFFQSVRFVFGCATSDPVPSITTVKTQAQLYTSWTW